MRIAVIMSVYRGDDAHHFEESIKSLVNQTYRIFDILLYVDGKISTKLKNNIHKINYLGHDLFITVRNIESLYFINIIINSICAVQFLKDIYPSLIDLRGGLIGRESFENIKLDSGIISWKNLNKIKLQPQTTIKRFIPVENIKFSDNYYKIYFDKFIYSKMVCLIPKGLTMNIVKGSNVYHYLNGKKISLLSLIHI